MKKLIKKISKEEQLLMELLGDDFNKEEYLKAKKEANKDIKDAKRNR